VASTSVSFVSEERIFRISPLESRIPASRAFPSTLVLLATPVRRARRSRMPIRCLQRLIASKDSTSRREVRVRHPRLRTPQDWSRRHRKRRYNSLLISSRLHRNVRPLFCSLPVPHFLTFALFQATSAPICSAWRTSLPLPSTDLSPVLPTPLKPFAVAVFPFTSLARIVRFLLPLLPTRSANLVLFHSIGGGGGGRLTSGRWRSIELFPGAFSSSCLVISPSVIAHLLIPLRRPQDLSALPRPLSGAERHLLLAFPSFRHLPRGTLIPLPPLTLFVLMFSSFRKSTNTSRSSSVCTSTLDSPSWLDPSSSLPATVSLLPSSKQRRPLLTLGA
jgi:hypothetical protein